MRKLPTRLYFFPAVLPLMAIMPWLLTAFGAVAGVVLGLLGRRRNATLMVTGLVLFLAAGAVATVLLWPRLYWTANTEGTTLTPTAKLPKTETLSDLSDITELPKQNIGGAAWDTWKPLWSRPVQRRPLSDPVLVGGLVIVGTWEGTVDAYSLNKGVPIWSMKKKEPVIALSAAAPDLLLAGEGVHTAISAGLTAIRLPEGTALWNREFKGHLESPPAYSAEKKKIWLGSGPGGFWCLDARDGSVLWRKAGTHVDSTPLLLGNLVFFAGQENDKVKESVFYALDQDTGAEAWRIALPGQPWGSPVFDEKNGLILTSSGIGQIGVSLPTDRGWAHAISLAEKKIRWTQPLPGNPLESSVHVPSLGLVVFGITKGAVVALKSETGEKAWEMPLPEQVVAQPDIDLDHVPPRLAILAMDGKLRVQNVSTGAFLDEHAFAPGSNSAPRFLKDGILLALPGAVERYRW